MVPRQMEERPPYPDKHNARPLSSVRSSCLYMHATNCHLLPNTYHHIYIRRQNCTFQGISTANQKLMMQQMSKMINCYLVLELVDINLLHTLLPLDSTEQPEGTSQQHNHCKSHSSPKKEGGIWKIWPQCQSANPFMYSL